MAAKKRAAKPSKTKPRRTTAKPVTRGASAKRSKGRPKVAPGPVSVTTATLALVQFEPLRAEASAALSRGETVQLWTGTGEEAARVETVVFAPSAKAAQSMGTYVHRGDWSGGRVLTDKGHLLDTGGSCFCRDCEAAKGYTLDDDE